jgi:hypothetical protein
VSGKEIVNREDMAPSPEQPRSLVQFALDRDLSPELLERLIALEERVSERNARAAFFEALSGFQGDCPQIKKAKTAKIVTKTGGAYSYTYAPLDEITRTIRAPLQRHGLSYSWDSEIAGGVLTATCILRHIDGHAERATFSAPVGTDAKMSDAQKHGAALTYARRQSLESVLGLSTSDDTDAPGSDSETISESQAADLRALAEDVGADKPAFLRWLGVESFGDVAVTQLASAISALEKKRK